MELEAEKYKLTELGLIPQDWDLKEFVEVMDGFSSGQTPYRAIPEFYKGNIPWITSGELNYNVITDTIEKITIEGAREANLKMIPKGTFLFAITGLEAAGTRGSCAITGIEATTNQSCMALYPKKGFLITPYLYHYYVRYGNELAFKYCQGTKQQSYTGGIVKKLPILVPPTIEEQTAIATALSDADALISSLEKLITKKRNIKQGAMQKLLQPKEGWEVKKLGEIAEIATGTTPPTSDLENYGSEYCFVSPSDLGIIKYITKTDKNLSKKGFGIARKFPKNSILFTCIGSTIGKVGIASFEMTSNQQINAIFPNDNFSIEFIYYYLNLISEKIKLSASEQAVPMINKTEFAKTEISIPTKEGQTSIATILSDMDTEISALETKLEKYKKLKLGMMQNLLTGKIRLV
jgi:type I restriction enzyme S subunit